LLTPREGQVLPLIVGGFLNKQAAAELGISEVTLHFTEAGSCIRWRQSLSRTWFAWRAS